MGFGQRVATLAPVLPLPAVRLRMLTVEFVGDHRVLTTRNRTKTPDGNPYGWDYALGGTRFADLPGRTWEAGRAAQVVDGDEVPPCFPVSYTRRSLVVVDAEVAVEASSGSPPEPAILEARVRVGSWRHGGLVDPEVLHLRSQPISLDAAHSPRNVRLSAAVPLPDGPIYLYDIVWQWDAVLQDGALEPGRRLQAGATGYHKILVTSGTPQTGVESRECGVTRRRLTRAVRLVHEACQERWGRFEGVSVRDLVIALHRRLGGIDYRPSPPMSAPYTIGTNAVSYLSSWRPVRAPAPQEPHPPQTWVSASEWGGTWPHADYTKVRRRDASTRAIVQAKCGAECQAFVRLAYGVMKQVGVDAELEKAVVYAHSASGGATQCGMKPLYTSFPDEPMPRTGWQQDYASTKQIDVLVKHHTPGGEIVEREKLDCRLCLITRLPGANPELEVGRIYARAPGRFEPGVDYLPTDKYEAVLRVYADGDLSYYAGGVGVLAPFDRAAPLADQDDELRLRVLYNSFRHLAWLGEYPPRRRERPYWVAAWASEPYEKIENLADLRRRREALSRP